MAEGSAARELSPRKRPPTAAEEERCASRPPPEGAGAAAGTEPRPLERAAAGGWCRSCQAQLAELRRQAARLAAGGCPPNAPPVSSPTPPVQRRAPPGGSGRRRGEGWGGGWGWGVRGPRERGQVCIPSDLGGERDGKAGDFQAGRALQKFQDFPSRALSKSETVRLDAPPLLQSPPARNCYEKIVTLWGGAAGGCAGAVRDAAGCSPAPGYRASSSSRSRWPLTARLGDAVSGLPAACCGWASQPLRPSYEKLLVAAGQLLLPRSP